MIRRFSGFVLAIVAMLSIANVISQAEPQSFLTNHVREATTNGQARSVGRLPAAQSLRFDVVLALRHQPELENFLQEVYDPSSASYRHFVTVPEFTARFGPSQEDYDAVLRFAEANNFTVMGGSRDGMDVQLKGTVANVEAAFHVTLGVYQHPTENRTFYAPDREPTVSLPFQLWHVTGLDNFSTPRPQYRKNSQFKSNVVKGSCPNNSYCGSDMRAAYYGATALNGKGQTLGLLEYAGYDIVDLNTYFKNTGQTNNVPINGISTDGTPVLCTEANGGCDDTEQTIDMTQAIGMAPGLNGIYVYVGSSDTAMFSSMSTNSPLNAQISSSWTWSPADPNTDNPFFLKFAAQGQNFFQAAGDGGSYAPLGGVYWPSVSQYVTTVGGTDLQVTGPGGGWVSESAWVDGGGGYSFNAKILIPTWQQLPGVITSANKGSTEFRNAPDVAAESNFDFYYCSDQKANCSTGLGGTSFAAPMWAGYLALVNEQALLNGNPVLGFVNPAIYAIGVSATYDTDFHDTTVGSNGYPAVTGYDLATGWGSPNGVALITALAGSGGGGGGAVVSLSPTSLAWGKVVVGVKSSAKTVTLTNTGSATLDISGIAVSGDFSQTIVKKSCGSTVLAGASCVIKIAFTPTQTGVRTGAVTITDNAPNSPQSIALSGTGK